MNVQDAVQYETVPASATAQILGGAGAAGDYIAGLLVTPTVVGIGVVTLLDGGTSIPICVAGTLPTIAPFYVPLGIQSRNGGWKVTTGAGVTVVAIGNFS